MIATARQDSESGGSMVPPSDDLKSYLKTYYRTNGDHAARYHLAKGWLSHERVLEIGCGYGVGACLLAPNYSEYLGVDTDPAAIRWAKRIVEPEMPHSTFLTVEEFHASGAVTNFDCSIAFEVLEHVREPTVLIRSLTQATRAHGLVILSTPNGAWSFHERSLFRSPSHIDEYDIHEVEELVSGAGHNPRYYKQRRVDWMDVVVLSRKIQLSGKYPAVGSNPRSTWAKLMGIAFRHLNGRRWWVIIPANLDQMASLDYSNIVFRFEVAGLRH